MVCSSLNLCKHNCLLKFFTVHSQGLWKIGPRTSSAMLLPHSTVNVSSSQIEQAGFHLPLSENKS